MEISYGLENLRRIKEMPLVPLKPITILVGRNSAGKSTFLRSFQLIRQSLETRSSAPILWYGDYVDYGEFESAVFDNDETNSISFKFLIDSAKGTYFSRIKSYFRRHIEFEVENTSVEFTIGLSGKKTVLESIRLRDPIRDLESQFCFKGPKKSEAFLVNGVDILNIYKDTKIRHQAGGLFNPPTIVKTRRVKFRDSTRKESTRMMVTYDDEAIHRFLTDFLRAQLPKNLSPNTVSAEAKQIINSPYFSENILRSWAATASTQAFRKLYRKLLESPDDPISKRIKLLHNASASIKILHIINDNLSNFFAGISYLGPARARSERYYRKQELEVNEILPDGQNFPMFLASLSSEKINDFSNWVQSLFGFGVQLRDKEGHISINLVSNTKVVNVTDTGYGVSQLLPVLGQIWRNIDISNSPRHRHIRKRTIAIEQPELHLHPAHQALLADTFAGAINLSRGKTGIIVETHSESLINRLGELIADGALKAENAQVLIFGAPDDIHSATNISVANFNDEGILENWPYGFFNYSIR